MHRLVYHEESEWHSRVPNAKEVGARTAQSGARTAFGAATGANIHVGINGTREAGTNRAQRRSARPPRRHDQERHDPYAQNYRKKPSPSCRPGELFRDPLGMTQNAYVFLSSLARAKLKRSTRSVFATRALV